MDSKTESKKRFKLNKSTLYWVILIIILFSIVLIVDRFYQKEFNRFDNIHISAKGNIQNKDSITCHVTHSTHEYGSLSQWQYELPEFEISGLNSDVVQFVIDGKPWGKWYVQYDTPDYITLMIEPSWDMDTIGIDKENGTFVRTMHGVEGGTYQYAIAQKGWCE